ncbi:Endo-1,4-beta-xylanase A precursor [Enhygromyxa salina]|uniref:Endo-1,4-beta-xylanase A n=1 Tax=Enhygromyxa salina TaxID=215803 RepID=A0A0C2D7N0_9BACT|nr:Endo-1,4-beta-xylanase A precursor [Enhygromyxa salina]
MALICALPLACFDGASNDETSNPTETSGDGDPGDGDGDPGDGDGDGDPGDGDGDPGDSAPQFVSFTVNMSTNPGVVTSASGIMIEAELSDLDMDVNYVVFKRDGETIATFANDPGPSYAFEWVASGAELDGTYELTAEATDAADNMVISDGVSVTLGMAAGGSEVDNWDYDSGQLDAAYDLAVSPNGDDLVITGQRTDDLASQQRTDRVVGPSWANKVEIGSAYGAAVTQREDGGYFVAGAIPKPNNKSDSALYHYDAAGVLMESTVFDGSSQPDMADDADNPIAAEPAPGGVLIMGTYFASGGSQEDKWVTYVRRYTDAMDFEWERFPSEALSGRPFAYDFAAASDGSYVLVGGQFAETPIKPWMGRFNAQGMVVNEVQINDYGAGILHAVDIAADGSVVVGGQAPVDGEALSWVRSYDPNGAMQWDVVVPITDLGVVAALAIDPWGEVVAVSTEGCSSPGLRYESCDLAIRKYDPSGQLMWEQIYPGGGFLGPNLLFLGFDAAVEVDRFGYVYVSAIAYDVGGTNWWARKLNP